MKRTGALEFMKKYWIMFSFLIVWTVLTILAVSWGNRFDLPDYIHIDYGLPFVWATQTLSTIVGPVNLWAVEVSSLVIDLAFWLGIMAIVVMVLLFFFNRQVIDGKR